MSLLTYIYFANLAFLIINHNLGGSFEASLAQSLYLIAGSMSNIYMLHIKNYSSKLLFAIKFMFIGVAFLSMSSFNITLYHIYIGSFVLGLGYGGISVVLIMFITEYTSKMSRVNAVALLTVSLFLGQFLSPIFFKEFNLLFGITSDIIDFLIVGLLFSLTTIILIYLFIKERKELKLINNNVKY